MSKRLPWLMFALTFIGGVLLGFLGSVFAPHLGLVALYERQGGWALLGRVAVGLLLIAVPLGYIVWLIAGAVEFARPREGVETQHPLHYLQHGERTEIRRVLVSTGGGPHASFGLHLAASIARSGDGAVTLFRVLPPTGDVDTEAELRALDRMAHPIISPGCAVEARVATSPSIADAILEEASQGDYDLLIVGASDEGTVRKLLFGTIPEAVVGRTSCPVLIARTPVG